MKNLLTKKMKKSKIKIGISLRVVEEKNYTEKRDALSQNWTTFLEEINILPVFIPNTLSNLRSFLENMEICGIILSGGDNIGDHPERDKTEKEIIAFGIENEIPIFGVCRGMQVVNKYFGGKIIQKVGSDHVGKSHKITFTNEVFSSLLQASSIEVNSYHHNVITNEGLGTDLEPFAISSDDTIEGFYHKLLPIEGVMWHPERDQNSYNKIILNKFFQDKAFWRNQG